jgi:hypothetical protein
MREETGERVCEALGDDANAAHDVAAFGTITKALQGASFAALAR